MVYSTIYRAQLDTDFAWNDDQDLMVHRLTASHLCAEPFCVSFLGNFVEFMELELFGKTMLAVNRK